MYKQFLSMQISSLESSNTTPHEDQERQSQSNHCSYTINIIQIRVSTCINNMILGSLVREYLLFFLAYPSQSHTLG